MTGSTEDHGSRGQQALFAMQVSHRAAEKPARQRGRKPGLGFGKRRKATLLKWVADPRYENYHDLGTHPTPTATSLEHEHAGPPALVSDSAEVESSEGLDTTQARYKVALPSTSSPEAMEEFKERVRADPLGMFLDVREGGDDALLTYSSEFYASAIWRCIHEDLKQYIPMFVRDAIMVLDKRPSKTRGRKIIEILFSTLSAKPMLKKEHIVALLQSLEKYDQLRFIRTKTRLVVARAYVAYPPDDTLDPKVYELLVPLLLEKVGKLEEWTSAAVQLARESDLESTETGVSVPRVLWPLYRIIIRLARLRHKTMASKLLASLVDREYVDAQAINATDLASRDFDYVVLSVCARTCLRNGWFTRATKLMLEIVGPLHSISTPMAQLIEEWLVAALSNPREVDVRTAAGMISKVFLHTEEYRFYDVAFDLNLPNVAQTVYARSLSVRHHSYPPPHDLSLLRLMEYIATKSRDVRLAHRNIPLHAAVLGFASQARALWERYAAGTDAAVVVANRSTMIQRAERKASSQAQHKKWDARRKNANGSASGDQDEASQKTPQRPLEKEGKEEGFPASDAPRSAAPPPPHDYFNEREPPSSDGSDGSARGEYEEREREAKELDAMTHSELVARAADLRAFAERVVDAFYEHKQPLAHAAHFDLNALARGAALVRRERLAMDIFKLIKQRGLQLDVHDVNVALDIVSKADPVMGAKYLDDLLASQLEPDAVSFGTVIHYAARDGNAPLVRSLLQKARENGIEQLTFKTLSSLLHSTLKGKLPLGEERTWAAEMAYARDILRAMEAGGTTPTPNVVRDCVGVALRARQPEEAYKLWSTYIWRKVEWDDSGQRRLRAAIAGQLYGRYQRGVLEHPRLVALLHHLGFTEAQFAQFRKAAPWQAKGAHRGARPLGPAPTRDL
ncbi:hypothetical protein BD413DRAFT_604489 [Trametes elegans]|nr:hypothetical protein BD413DRAFT_604489 [Trametes elegans]